MIHCVPTLETLLIEISIHYYIHKAIFQQPLIDLSFVACWGQPSFMFSPFVLGSVKWKRRSPAVCCMHYDMWVIAESFDGVCQRVKYILVCNWAFVLHGPVHFVLDMINISALPRKGRRTKISEVRSCSSIKEVSAYNLWICTIQLCRYYKSILYYIHLPLNQGVFGKTEAISQ